MRTLVCLLIAIAAGTTGCNSNSTGAPNSSAVNSEYQAQVDTFNRQTKEQDEINDRSLKLLVDSEADYVRSRKILDEQDLQTKRISEYLDKQDEQNARFDRILAKYEEQARRQDAILAAEEKRLGIKQEE